MTQSTPPSGAGRWVFPAAIGSLVLVTVAVLATTGDPALCDWPENFSPEDTQPRRVLDGPKPLPDHFIIAAYEKDVAGDREKVQKIYALNILTRQHRFLADGAGPTVSPDRRHITYLVTDGELRVPWIMTVDGKNRRPLETGKDCPSATRLSWNQAGNLLAAMCEDEAENAIKAIYIFRSSGGVYRVLDTAGIPESRGAPTWVGNQAIVYSEVDPESLRARLWLIPSIDEDPVPNPLSHSDDETSDINPDWSPERKSLLFLRSSSVGEAVGTLWTCGLDDEAGQWGSEASIFAPTWSPDGTGIAFLLRDDESTNELRWATFDEADDPSLWGKPAGPALSGATPIPPAWGSR